MGRRYCAASNKTDEEVEIHFRPDDIVIAVGDVFYAIANVEMGDAAWTLVVLYLTSTNESETGLLQPTVTVIDP
ncbi:hypothetical protein F2Q70_00043438 [Brassica cretica]|uniref:Uncharacterized protein n=1 Tax=Brassica cretica TaxID=69181 RepID=A0A8S9KES6_BRACR|nr:hypothetical protein F2Q70_00043438 [Brassica cretica]